MKRLVIFGVGEFAQIAYEYFTHDSEYEVVAFVVDEEFVPKPPNLFGLRVLPRGQVTDVFSPSDTEVFVAIPATNLNKNRESVCAWFKERHYNLASYVSSRAFVWHNVMLGENCFIFENNVLQPWVTVGDRVVMWSGNHIGHRSVIESDCFLTSQVVVSGYCRVGHHSFLGVNATVSDGINISPNTIVGAASHINRNTEEGLVYVGSPAKPIPGKTSSDIRL